MNKKLLAALPVIPLLAVLMPGTATPAARTPCEGLKSLSAPDVSIDIAASVPAGDFTLPGGQRGQTFKDLPAFCRIAATLKPSSDSDIKIEVWMPANNWNGKFQAEGNGGWAGTISYPAMADALKAGYATTSTDTGHTDPGGKFTYGHPEKQIDFSPRSEHEMTVKAKALINAFYGNAPTQSYWNGCSTGGRQGLIEATRYPDDFTAIIAGDPANPRAYLGARQVMISVPIQKNKASFIPQEKLTALHKAVIAQCDALDGVKDGLIENPKACKFDPQTVVCKAGADAVDCLTQPQVETAKAIMGPGKYSNGKEFFPGFEPGSEWGWTIQETPDPRVTDHYTYIVFKNPDWDPATLNPDTDIPKAWEAGKEIDVQTADLSKFKAHGGKLIMYHGWSDNQVPSQASINYYKQLVDANGTDFVRLFMVPGMGHCRGGDGIVPNNFDMPTALDTWITKGVVPTQVLASHAAADGKTDRTRPLCAYPAQAKYKGTGSIDDAANFVCTAPN